jgi:hypothetical protein
MPKAPRNPDTYRAARRNACRNVGKLTAWRDHEGVVHRVKRQRIAHSPLPADKPNPAPLLDAAE